MYIAYLIIIKKLAKRKAVIVRFYESFIESYYYIIIMVKTYIIGKYLNM